MLYNTKECNELLYTLSYRVTLLITAFGSLKSSNFVFQLIPLISSYRNMLTTAQTELWIA